MLTNFAVLNNYLSIRVFLGYLTSGPEGDGASKYKQLLRTGRCIVGNNSFGWFDFDFWQFR
jgi:hypothetical protein